MAGEVPVAIIRFQGPAAEDPKAIFAKLKELALRELGPKLAPTMYIDLKEDLGMQMFPMTSSGKVKKTVLRQKVQELVAQRTRLQNSERLATGGTADVLIEIWSQVSGIDPEKIDATTEVLTFVDSITIMRFSGAVRKRLQKDITVTEVGRYTNVQEQARLLDSREVIAGSAVEKRVGAPTAAEMVHCQDDKSKEYHTRKLAMPLLTKLGLDWDNDVEDVFPAPGTISSIYLRRSRPQTWNQRVIFIAHHTSLSEFANAWKATLCHQPLGMYSYSQSFFTQCQCLTSSETMNGCSRNLPLAYIISRSLHSKCDVRLVVGHYKRTIRCCQGSRLSVRHC